MLDLQKTIREKVYTQILSASRYQKKDIIDAIDRAWWVYDRYGIAARTSPGIRAPVKRALANNAIKIPIDRINRIMTTNNFSLMHENFRRDVRDEELVELVSDEGVVNRYKLASELDISVRDLTYRIRKEEYNWNLLRIGDEIWDTEYFIQQQDWTGENKSEIVVIEVLKRYPYLNINQLELLTGIRRMNLAKPISDLHHRGDLIRGLTRENAPDEIFNLSEYDDSDIDWEAIMPFVLEKRDALVQSIKQERYFNTEESNYWLFGKGLPQAEFDLIKIKQSRRYKVKNIRRFPTTQFQLQELLELFKSWAKLVKLHIELDMISDPSSQLATHITSLLIKRGYELSETGLGIRFGQSKELKKERTAKPKTNQIGLWMKQKQQFDFTGSPEKLLQQLGQLDDIQSIAYRLNQPPNKMDLSNVVYLPGINNRMGFVDKSSVQYIIEGWPKSSKTNFLDRKIIDLLDIPRNLDELVKETGRLKTEIKSRLPFLEQNRIIRRDTSYALDFKTCKWIKFETKIPGLKRYHKSKPSLVAVGYFMLKLLQTNPPLTVAQLTRYLGLTKRDLTPLIDQFSRTSKIIEGYFTTNQDKHQYTVPDVLDEIELFEIDTGDDVSAATRIDLLPVTDPYSLLHLPAVVLNNPSIQQTERPPPGSTQWMITWDGNPIGYLIKSPSSRAMIDYDLDIKVIKKMTTSAVISGTLQKIVTLMRSWYGDEGYVSTINNTSPQDERWKNIHFLMDSIGIAY